MADAAAGEEGHAATLLLTAATGRAGGWKSLRLTSYLAGAATLLASSMSRHFLS